MRGALQNAGKEKQSGGPVQKVKKELEPQQP
jgi:hypothetical protein